MRRRVTLVEIASRAGVGRSTASRALSDHPACAAGTRARIRALAKEMGYVPDPALAALVTHREDQRAVRVPMSVALVSGNLGAGPGEYVWEVWNALGRECAARGYGEVQRFHSRRHEPAALGRMLRARGVRGIVWGWLREERYLREFPWEWFAHVGFLLPVVNPAVTCVRDDAFRTVYDAVHAAFDHGFRRPGLMLMTSPDSWNDRYQKAGWLLAHAERNARPSEVWLSTRESPGVRTWLRAHRPDVVIANVESVRWLLRRAAGRNAPPLLNLLHASADHPGFDCAEAQIGRILVKELDRQIRHNELGLRENPQTILVRRRFLGWEGSA